MKPSTLARIVEEMSKFLPVVKALKDMHADVYPVIGVLYVIVRNLSRDVTHCVNYKHESAVEEVQKALIVFKTVTAYEDTFYSAQYICKEAKMIIEGNEMSEEHDNNAPL